MLEVSKRVKRFISLALHESTKSTYGRVSIGAVIVDGNYVVSHAHNATRSHPEQARLNRETNRSCVGNCIHAEVAALVKSRSYDVSGCEIFVARFDRTGRMAMCKPCCACERGLRSAGISRCYYTTNEGVKVLEF